MAVTFQADANKVAIYKSTSDGPFNNPESYIGITKFHSSWQYLPIEPARTIEASVSVPATLAGSSRTITLGAHGQAGVPFIGGYAVIGGQNVPFAGTIPIFAATNGSIIAWTLGVDATNVIIFEMRSNPLSFSVPSPIDVVVFISSKLAA